MKKILLAFSVIVLSAFGVVVAAQNVRYEFDAVEVRYAAEFTARPIAKPTAPDDENWIVRIAGGADKPITVLYGVVDFKKSGASAGSEEFIKVSGAGGSERFLLNSVANDYYVGTSNYSRIKSFFWSAKKLEERDGVVSVVKNFTPPITSIALSREFSESKELRSFVLSFSNDGQRAVDEFWTAMPAGNFYAAEMNTLDQAGVSTAAVSQ